MSLSENQCSTIQASILNPPFLETGLWFIYIVWNNIQKYPFTQGLILISAVNTWFPVPTNTASTRTMCFTLRFLHRFNWTAWDYGINLKHYHQNFLCKVKYWQWCLCLSYLVPMNYPLYWLLWIFNPLKISDLISPSVWSWHFKYQGF